MFHHQNSRSSKHRKLSVSSDKFTVLNRIPTLFGKNSLFNTGIATIASKWRTSMRKQEPQRIDITLDGLECLQSIFDTCVTSVIEDPPFVNLRNFLREVSCSRFLIDTLGVGRAQVVSSEIFRLENPGSHNQFISWFKLRELLESQTLLNFPITCESIMQLADYKQLLERSGIPSMPMPMPMPTRAGTSTLELPIVDVEDAIPLSVVSSRYKDISATLEEQHNVIRRLEEHSLVNERIEAMMKGTEEDSEEERKTCLRNMRFSLLGEEDIERVRNVLQGQGNDQVIIEKFNIPVTKNKMLCLKPSSWLNDEVM